MSLIRMRIVEVGWKSFSEMGLSDLIKGRVFRAADLPLRLTALSRCYRPEVSKTVWEARLYRVHEFTKVCYFFTYRFVIEDFIIIPTIK